MPKLKTLFAALFVALLGLATPLAMADTTSDEETTSMDFDDDEAYDVDDGECIMDADGYC